MSDQMPGGPGSMDHGGFDQVVAGHTTKRALEHDIAGAAVGAGVYYALRKGNQSHPHITAWIVLLVVLGFIAFVIYAVNFN